MSNEIKNISWAKITRLIIKEIGIIKYITIGLSDTGIILHLKEVIRFLIKGYMKKLKQSTGLVAVLLAKDNADKSFEQYEVDVSGIGILSDGYEYINGYYKRGHEEIDELLVENLSKKNVKFLDMDLK